MGFMTELRYRRDDLNDKLKEAPMWVWPVVGGALLLIAITPVTCKMIGRPSRAVSVSQERMDVRRHMTEVYAEIIHQLMETRSRDLGQMLDAMVLDRGAEYFRCPVTDEAYRINPDIRAWLVTVPGTPPPPAGVAGQVLIYGKTDEAQQKAGVHFVGLRSGRIPANIAEGETPEWTDRALTPGA